MWRQLPKDRLLDQGYTDVVASAWPTQRSVRTAEARDGRQKVVLDEQLGSAFKSCPDTVCRIAPTTASTGDNFLALTARSIGPPGSFAMGHIEPSGAIGEWPLFSSTSAVRSSAKAANDVSGPD